MKKYLMIVGLFLISHLTFTQSYGQSKRELTAAQKSAAAAQVKRATTFSSRTLQIGDKVPDILMAKIFNYPKGRARLSDFRGKHILLDFWSRRCSSCIGAFPKMEKLQKQFKDRIQVLAVCTFNTWEELNLYEPGFPKASMSVGISETTLPLVFNSEDMADFFPHTFEPYLVWIDTAGVVRAMLDGIDVNQEAITNLLNGKYNIYPLAKSFMRVMDPQRHQNYDPDQPILEEGYGRQVNKVIYLKKSDEFPNAYVILAKLGFTEVMPRPIYDTVTGQQIGIRGACLDLMGLFRAAYPIDPQLLIIESPYKEKYDLSASVISPDQRRDWERDNIYAYEVVGPSEEVRSRLLREALGDYFKSIRVIREKRNIKCWELRKISRDDKIKTRFPNKGMSADKSFNLLAFKNYDYGVFFQYFQFYNQLIHRWGQFGEFRPIFDETGYDAGKKIDIELRNLDNISGIDIQLRKYGLTLHETYRFVDVLVLKEFAI